MFRYVLVSDYMGAICMQFLKVLRDIKSALWRFLPFVYLRGLWSVYSSGAVVIAIGFSTWKEEFVRHFFLGKVVIFINDQRSLGHLTQILKDVDLEVVVWSFKNEEMGIDLSVCDGKTVWHMEDGFIRSIGRGLDHVPPWSLCLDSQGAYFDASAPSDFEDMCNQFDEGLFSREQRETAAQLISSLRESGITKYNLFSYLNDSAVLQFDGSGVLVLGQVEDDQSILRNDNVISTNSGLLKQAISDHPELTIFFKQHPDCLGERGRPGYVDISQYHGVIEIPQDMPITIAIKGVQEVYTISSLGGFEALLRGKQVTTFGCPFYAGWGITNDHVQFLRRQRNLALEEIFYLAYVKYSIYFDPTNGRRLNAKHVLDRFQKRTVS